MELIKYVILGIIQGLTEPLPISSSGHLLIFRELFNTNMFNDLNFEVMVNFGSFIAILIIFWKDIVRLVTSFIPVGIIGLIFKDKIEAFASVKEVGFALLITALALFIVKNSKGKKKDNEITYKDAIIIGLFQMCALLPGLSRSGMVLVGCLLCGLNRESSLKYTFMLYFPVSVASFGLSSIDVLKSGIASNLLLSYFLGMVAAGIVTYFTYQWLSKIVQNGKLWKFSIYCVVVALFIFIYFR